MGHPTDSIWQSCDQWQAPLRYLLYDAVIETSAKTVLEIGTNIGDSTRILSTALRVTSGQLYSLDKESARTSWTVGWDCSNIQFIQDNSLSYAWEKPLNLLLINGGHDYDTALSDLTRFHSFVQSGGRILVHDTTLFEAVRQALYDWSVKAQQPYHQYPYGVGLAVIQR